MDSLSAITIRATLLLGLIVPAVAYAADAAADPAVESAVESAVEPGVEPAEAAAADPAAVVAESPAAGAEGAAEPAVVEEAVADYVPSHDWPDDEGVGPALDRCRPEVWPAAAYTICDVLFLERDNATNNRPIVLDSFHGPSFDTPVFTPRSMVFATAPGVRLVHGRRAADGTGWQVGYWGVWGMFGDARADLDGGLAVPGALGQAVPGWANADTIQPIYSSSLNVIELDLLRHDARAIHDRCSGAPWRRVPGAANVDWTGGLFWAGLDELAALRVTADAGEPPTAYRVATGSQLFGAQVGARGRREWREFVLEGAFKVGLGGAWLDQSAAPITSSLTGGLEYRPGITSATTGAGFLSTMNLAAVYRFSDTLGLRVGYNLAWLSGLALAANQWDFTDSPTSGRTLQGAGGLFLHGASLGLEAAW